MGTIVMDLARLVQQVETWSDQKHDKHSSESFRAPFSIPEITGYEI